MTANNAPCIFIVGPTCAGKTKLGIALAEALDGEVISVDSLQCYISGPLITAQPTLDETKNIPHHMIGYLSDEDEPHIDYVPRAMDVLASIQARGKTALFVGGSTSLIMPMLRAVLERRHSIQVLLLSPFVEGVEYERQARKRINQMVSSGLVKELLMMQQREIASGSYQPSARCSPMGWMKRLLASCQSGSTLDKHVGVWKAIGYSEMFPYVHALSKSEDHPNLLDKGLDACVANTVRYAIGQARWVRSELIPFIHSRGIPFSSLPVLFASEVWKSRVLEPAVNIAQQFSKPIKAASGNTSSAETLIGKSLDPVVCIFGGSSPGKSSEHAAAARSLAQAFHRHGIHMVYGGGITGIMGEIAGELVRLSGPRAVHGVIPKALADYEAKMIAIRGTDLRYDEKIHGRRTVVEDMHTRKARMVQEVLRGGHGSGFVALSGGYGTAEELMEMVTWRQLGIHDKPVCALNADGIYDGLISWLKSVSYAGFVSAKDQGLLTVGSTADEIIDRLFAQQELNPNGLKW